MKAPGASNSEKLIEKTTSAGKKLLILINYLVRTSAGSVFNKGAITKKL